MRILFLNRAFLPDVEATGQYLAELAEDLSARHEVHVLCGMPNFGQLDGRVFPWRKEQWDKVTVWRAWNVRLPKRFKLARMANQASYFAMAHVAARRVPRPDVVVSYTDPPFLGLLALRLKRKYGIPFVLYCQDLYPDVLEAIDMAPPVLTAGFRWVQRRLLAGADRVIALGEDMAERLRAKGVPTEKVSVLHHWADTEAIRPIPREENAFRKELGIDGRFVAMYSGNLGHVWDLDTVLDAAAMLRDRDDILFVIIGDGSTRPRIESRVRSENLTNVRLLPYQPREHLAETLSAADVHLVPMRKGVYGTVVPSKIYGILAAGRPMVVLGEAECEALRTVKGTECGWHGAPGDSGFLRDCLSSAAALRGSVLRTGDAARRAGVTRYARDGQTAKFEGVVTALGDH